jgi:hypothetical protein
MPPRKLARALLYVHGMGDLGTLVHGDFGGEADLALQSADD